MKKDNLMAVVLGLVVGLVIGFVFANSVNKNSAVEQQVSAQNDKSGDKQAGKISPGGNPALPPNHPPLGTSSGDADDSDGGGNAGSAPPASGAPLPQISAAIEKAKQKPQDFEAQMTAADLYYQIQRFDESAKFYEAAAKLKPGEAEPMIKAGNAYFDAEKYEQAEKWYLQAIEKAPKNINVRTDLGLTYYLREPRDIDKAIKQYKASLAIDPNHEITLQNLALAYNDNGDKENLRTTLEKLKSVNPNNPAVKKLEGSL